MVPILIWYQLWFRFRSSPCPAARGFSLPCRRRPPAQPPPAQGLLPQPPELPAPASPPPPSLLRHRFRARLPLRSRRRPPAPSLRPRPRPRPGRQVPAATAPGRRTRPRQRQAAAARVLPAQATALPAGPRPDAEPTAALWPATAAASPGRRRTPPRPPRFAAPPSGQTQPRPVNAPPGRRAFSRSPPDCSTPLPCCVHARWTHLPPPRPDSPSGTSPAQAHTPPSPLLHPAASSPMGGPLHRRPWSDPRLLPAAPASQLPTGLSRLRFTDLESPSCALHRLPARRHPRHDPGRCDGLAGARARCLPRPGA
jgi:hypothetical protein